VQWHSAIAWNREPLIGPSSAVIVAGRSVPARRQSGPASGTHLATDPIRAAVTQRSHLWDATPCTPRLTLMLRLGWRLSRRYALCLVSGPNGDKVRIARRTQQPRNLADVQLLDPMPSADLAYRFHADHSRSLRLPKGGAARQPGAFYVIRLPETWSVLRDSQQHMGRTPLAWRDQYLLLHVQHHRHRWGGAGTPGRRRSCRDVCTCS
jgi:hypothetical protein